jgi:uncharacterized protein (DUF2252 family)
MAAKVFISYRRDDSKYQARMIHAAFCRIIPSDHVFMDVDTIRPGENFRQVIQGWVNQCEVLLALIGPGWIDASDPKTKRRRLDNPSDFVRVEIGEALVRGIPVVPVLLDDTQIPDVSLLPDELKELVERQAEFVEYRTFDTDVERLIGRLGFAAPSPQEEAERYQQGIVLRRESPRESHSDLGPRDPVRILAAGDRARVPHLVPVRYERMLTSPFSFFRGAAAVMVQDLKNEPSAGIAVQACGDCHLMNFGAFTTPERRILFDINDFDETLPGVDFTVDLKRLATSVVLAALAAKLSTKQARATAAATVAAYRLRMAALAKLSPLKIRQSRIDLVQAVSQFKDRKLRKRLKAVLKKVAKADGRDDNFPQMAEGGARIADQPPLIYHLGPKVAARDRFAADKVFASYKKSLPPDSLRVFEQYTLRDTAFKVVGIGSVGTFCVISLFTSKDGAPLFLQFKEAGTSVLECLGPKFEGHPGRRVADGQRILQATGDIFLGWADDAVSGRHFYVRQLKNRQLGSLSEIIEKNALEEYARLCANVLACAHARSADPAVIAGYMGEDDAFDYALSSFAMVYAARTQEDYDWLMRSRR